MSDYITGPLTRPDGAATSGRASKENAVVTMMAGGSYGEAASRAQIYTVMTAVAGTTVVAANNSPVGAAAASILSLYNPLNSGKNLEVLKTFICPVSGTPGVGAFVYNVAYNQTITATPNNGGTAAALPFTTYPGASVSVAKGYTQTALTGSAAQTALRPIVALFGGAWAATSPIPPVDLVDGEIVLPPGGLLSIASPATGTSFVVSCGITYREVAI